MADGPLILAAAALLAAGLLASLLAGRLRVPSVVLLLGAILSSTDGAAIFILLASTGRRREPASPTLDDTDRCGALTVDPCASATSSNLDDAPPSVAANLYA